LQYKRLFTAPAKQHVGQEAAEYIYFDLRITIGESNGTRHTNRRTGAEVKVEKKRCLWNIKHFY